MQLGRGAVAIRWILLGTGFALQGCGEVGPHSVAPAPATAARAASRFEVATAGTIGGQITWDGPLPLPEPLSIPANPLGSEVLRQKQVHPNPNAPQIEERTRGVGNAVIFLRGIDGHASKPWDLPPVQVQQYDCAFHIRQGGITSPFGFVRRGDAVVLVSSDPTFYALHGSGAAFFSYVFPDPGQPLIRRLPDKGVVELTSAAGYIWMRAYLFVDDHPHYARTDREGRFVLSQVPPGRYEIVCWMPNWVKARHERDPETGVVTRLIFRPPMELVQTVELAPGASVAVHFTASLGLFQPDGPPAPP